MQKALRLLLDAGYDAYIERGHLYVRDKEGGVSEVSNPAYLDCLLARKSH